MTAPAPSRTAAQPPHWPMDTVRIRLWDRRNATAVMSEFFTAEAVLERWGGGQGGSPVGFEVTFVGGQVVQGSHVFFNKGKRKVLLSTHVRRLLDSGAAAHPTDRRSQPDWLPRSVSTHHHPKEPDEHSRIFKWRPPRPAASAAAS